MLSLTVVVHATNATLPQTVTQEQIDAAIYNPGVSAWGRVEADGTTAVVVLTALLPRQPQAHTVTFQHSDA